MNINIFNASNGVSITDNNGVGTIFNNDVSIIIGKYLRIRK